MRPVPSNPRSFQLTLRIPPGNHTYKFLVDSVWSTHPSLHSKHPIQLTDDGVKHHSLLIHPPAPTSTDLHRDRIRDPHTNQSPLVTVTRLHDPVPAATVFRSASASAVPSHAHLRADRTQSDGASTPTSFSKTIPSVSMHEGSRRHVEMSPRGGSFNAPLPIGGISHMQAVNRKSLLQRVGAGWLRRFSNRPETTNFDPSCTSSMSHSQLSNQDRSGSALFRGKDRASLFPSSSEPSVGRVEDKENTCTMNKQFSFVSSSSDRSKRGTVRGSQRSSAVTVSMPTKVDEPKDKDEVNRQADNWRQMARHLQDNLFDPVSARELFAKAINHREKHGLWCTPQNAQVHVDLARNLSRAEKMKEAEFHLRLALRIYSQIDAGKEHIADLMLYVGVVVDRQRRREEAEDLYRQALQMYKDHKLAGNNVDIAVKNLSLNLRKQNREHEIERVHREFFKWKNDVAANA